MTEEIAPDPQRSGLPRPGSRRAGPRSAASRLAAGMAWRRWLVDMLLIAGGVISVIFEPMSIAIHSIVGLAFVALVGPHLWNRRHWIRGTLRSLRQRRRLARPRRWSLAQSVLLALLVLIVTVSGLWDWLGVPTRIRFHALSSLVLIAVAGWHGWTRHSWLTRRRSTTGVPGSAVADSEAADPSAAGSQAAGPAAVGGGARRRCRAVLNRQSPRGPPCVRATGHGAVKVAAPPGAQPRRGPIRQEGIRITTDNSASATHCRH